MNVPAEIVRVIEKHFSALIKEVNELKQEAVRTENLEGINNFTHLERGAITAMQTIKQIVGQTGEEEEE